jgi:hypothetical protein
MGIPTGGVPRLQVQRAAFGERENAAVWAEIEPVLLREVTAGDAPKQATRVRSAWSAGAWHLLFQMDDAYPWATLTGSDGPLWTEEVIEVFVDPVGDLDSYFEIEVNPLGTVTDLVLRRVASGWRKEFGWHAAGLESRVRLTPGGWEAELTIPFASVGPPEPAAGQVWRVNFLRIDRPLGAGSQPELSAWSPTGLRNFHRPECFGELEFCTTPEPGPLYS